MRSSLGCRRDTRVHRRAVRIRARSGLGDLSAVIDAVSTAYAGGITTYVISVGSDVALAHLKDVANVGQGFPASDATERFYLVTTQNALTVAFQTIIDGVRDCRLTLNGEINPMLAGRGEVRLDGQLLPMGDNGWRVIDEKTIELVGSACETIKSGEHALSARFPCEAVVKPPQ